MHNTRLDIYKYIDTRYEIRDIILKIITITIMLLLHPYLLVLPLLRHRLRLLLLQNLFRELGRYRVRGGIDGQ